MDYKNTLLFWSGVSFSIRLTAVFYWLSTMITPLAFHTEVMDASAPLPDAIMPHVSDQQKAMLAPVNFLLFK